MAENFSLTLFLLNMAETVIGDGIPPQMLAGYDMMLWSNRFAVIASVDPPLLLLLCSFCGWLQLLVVQYWRW